MKGKTSLMRRYKKYRAMKDKERQEERAIYKKAYRESKLKGLKSRAHREGLAAGKSGGGGFLGTLGNIGKDFNSNYKGSVLDLSADPIFGGQSRGRKKRKDNDDILGF